ncbi:MAG TPA: 2-succinyl-6-hydroxy-2,4-cyclohexadiene-1-carboxylate synthase, partial [Ktedonobacterales bacterium]|nr:2-succinyl-6-hydroxy-2,4-cyclohexadiene-1-carboxylate synthase [Ktedonobacterales bacterium]
KIATGQISMTPLTAILQIRKKSRHDMPNQRIAVNSVTLNADLRQPANLSSWPPPPTGEGETHPSRRATTPQHASHQSSAPTFVLLHGFTGSAAGWGDHLDAFAAAGLRVIALDMLGHGASDAPADPRRYAIEHARDDILAALRALGMQSGEAILLGYSMGGRIALYTALHAPGFFRGLILESASPGLPTAEERAARRASDEALATRIEREGIPAFVDYWENLPLFASQRTLPPERRQALREQRLRNSPQGLASSLRGVGAGAQPYLAGMLPTLTLPTLLIAGALDEKYTALARQMANTLPHARLTIVPNAGHAVHFERPGVFDALASAFRLKDAG